MMRMQSLTKHAEQATKNKNHVRCICFGGIGENRRDACRGCFLNDRRTGRIESITLKRYVRETGRTAMQHVSLWLLAVIILLRI